MEKLKEILAKLKLDENVFTPEVMDSIVAVFNTQLSEAKEEQGKELEEAKTEEIEAFKAEHVEGINSYLKIFVEEYTEKNKQQILETVQVKRAKDVLAKFDDIVQEFHISLKEDYVRDEEELEEYQEKYNVAVNKSIELEEELNGYKKEQLINSAAAEITVESEKSSFIKMAEKYEFEDEDTFKESIESLKENLHLFKKEDTPSDDVTVTAKPVEASTSTDDSNLEEGEVQDNQVAPLVESVTAKDDEMDRYLNILHA